MAWAEGTCRSGGSTKGLFESVSEAFLRADFGAVAGAGTPSVCRVGYSKRDTDFGGGRQGWFSGSKLLFEVVSKTDGSRPNKVAQVVNY